MSWPLDADHVSRTDGGEMTLGRIGENASLSPWQGLCPSAGKNNRGRIVRGWRGNCL